VAAVKATGLVCSAWGDAVAYLQVYCDARVDDDPKLVVDVTMAVGGRMSGTPLPEEARPTVEAMARTEARVVLRCRPYATFAQPPRHRPRAASAERESRRCLLPQMPQALTCTTAPFWSRGVGSGTVS
jgi:hypothetical protein